MSNWLRRIWYLVNRSRYERELVSEMNEHRAAMHDPSKFGDTHRLLERSRDEWGWNWLDDAMQDLAVGFRILMRSPAFAITSVLILSFGIGLNVTLYQVIQVAMLRPPAIKDSASWVRFLRSSPDSTTWTVAKEGTFGNADRGRLNLVAPTAGATGVRYVRFTMLSQQLTAPCSGAGVPRQYRTGAVHSVPPASRRAAATAPGTDGNPASSW